MNESDDSPPRIVGTVMAGYDGHRGWRAGNDAVLGFYEQLGYERFDVSNSGERLISDER